MSSITLDYTRAGLLNGVKHFIKGALLYAAIGGVGYAISYFTNWHPGTVYDTMILVGVGEVLQATSKWLRTQKEQFDAPTYPDGTPIDAPAA